MQYACIGDSITDGQLCIVQCDPCFTCTDRAVEIIRLTIMEKKMNEDIKCHTSQLYIQF